MVDFGQRLKSLRKTKKLTQEQLSNMLGLTKSVISAYESSLRYPSYEILIKIARIFGVTTDYLLGIEIKKRLDVSEISDENLEILIKLIDIIRNKK